MFSICGILGEIQDWAGLTEKTQLADYASAVHEKWHAIEKETKALGLEESITIVSVVFADIVRAIDAWIDASVKNATS